MSGGPERAVVRAACGSPGSTDGRMSASGSVFVSPRAAGFFCISPGREGLALEYAK